MYERSAIVLEKYLEKKIGFNKSVSIKTNFENYNRLVEEMKSYQSMLEEEEEILKKFEVIANQIEKTQKIQAKLSSENLELEEKRKVLFNDFESSAETLENKLIRVEEKIEKNNQNQHELREKYIESLKIFCERQKERNKCARKKREAETRHVTIIEEAWQKYNAIEEEDINKIISFRNEDKTEIKEELLEIMMKNGQKEKIPFNETVLKFAIDSRIDLCEREVQIYIEIFEKLKYLLNEVDNDFLLLSKYEKALRDASVKITFIEAEKEYIVNFLDNERMTVINGKMMHDKLMKEACANFKEDFKQMDNLYKLILKETANKATKKAYEELYNNLYLRNIESKERNFEEERTNLNLHMGTVINANYWRIEGIKNIYTVFKEQMENHFERNLEEFEKKEEPSFAKKYMEYNKNDDNDEMDIFTDIEEEKEIEVQELAKKEKKNVIKGEKTKTSEKKKSNKMDLDLDLDLELDEKEDTKIINIKEDFDVEAKKKNDSYFEEEIDDFDNEEDFFDEEDFDIDYDIDNSDDDIIIQEQKKNKKENLFDDDDDFFESKKNDLIKEDNVQIIMQNNEKNLLDDMDFEEEKDEVNEDDDFEKKEQNNIFSKLFKK